MGCSLVQNHHDCIVAGNGAQYGGTFAVVDVISHAAGIAGPGADDGNVLGEMEGNEAAGHQHFACALVVAALVHDVVGKNIDAKISTPLLENIFFKNAPLHDGAVVIEGDRIVAAKCILPVTQSDVPKSYGTRHRAAIGMSEISDAIILVVSEETGGISIAHGGTIHRDIAPDQLANLLQRHFGANRQKDRHATMGS